ncbi:MAG: N-acetylmuramoyl-L-alanine amidase, partial [Eubacteriaceae bacterium]|nr:N-acetylmuramoyl-L-alanine amidase [Eubacteriaceae bacterium]
METQLDLRLLKKSIGLLIALTLILMTFFLYYNPPAQAATTQTIIINPGHEAGTDTGAVNTSTGVTEVALNNALAIKVVQSLRNAGYNATLSHQI